MLECLWRPILRLLLSTFALVPACIKIYSDMDLGMCINPSVSALRRTCCLSVNPHGWMCMTTPFLRRSSGFSFPELSSNVCCGCANMLLPLELAGWIFLMSGVWRQSMGAVLYKTRIAESGDNGLKSLLLKLVVSKISTKMHSIYIGHIYPTYSPLCQFHLIIIQLIYTRSNTLLWNVFMFYFCIAHSNRISFNIGLNEFWNGHISYWQNMKN